MVMMPSELKATRPEYAEFTPRQFDGCIRQLVRREGFINYLNNKRKLEALEQKDWRKKLNLPEETPMELFEHL